MRCVEDRPLKYTPLWRLARHASHFRPTRALSEACLDVEVVEVVEPTYLNEHHDFLLWGKLQAPRGHMYVESRILSGGREGAERVATNQRAQAAKFGLFKVNHRPQRLLDALSASRHFLYW